MMRFIGYHNTAINIIGFMIYRYPTLQVYNSKIYHRNIMEVAGFMLRNANKENKRGKSAGSFTCSFFF